MAVKLYERSGSEFTLNLSTGGVQSQPRITWISSSRYVAVWTDFPLDGIAGTQIRAQIFEADGTPVGSDFLVNSSDVDNQTNPVVAQLAGGGFVVAWEDSYVGSDGSGSAIRYRVYTADGIGVGGEAVANTTALGPQTRPSIAGLEGGGFVITWTDGSSNNGSTTGPDIRGQLFSATGALSGTEFLVNTVTNRDQGNSSVVGLPGGGFAVLWQDASPGAFGTAPSEDRGTDIALQIFDSSAARVGGQRVVDTTTPTTAYVSGGAPWRVTAHNPVATVLSDGKLAVTWADAFDGYVYTRKLNADGSPAGGVQIVGEAFGTTYPAPALVALADGGYAISWTTHYGPQDSLDRGVVARIFGSDGAAQGAAFQVNGTSNGAQLASTMLALADGGFLVAWHDSGTTDISAQRFGEDPGVIGDIDPSVSSVSRAAIEDVRAAILVADGALNAEYSFELLDDSTGAFRLEGNRLVVADTTLLFGFAGSQATLTVRVTDQNGNSRVETVQIPLTSAPASAVFEAQPEFQAVVQSAAGYAANAPELVALPGGGYFMTWAEFRMSSNSYDIMGQFHGGDGSHGIPFVINTATPGAQLEGAPVLLANGNILVTWAGPAQANSGTGTLNDVRAQILDPSGAKVGGEIIVNTVTAGQQVRGNPAALADGGFLVTWTDSSQAQDMSGNGIKAQFFSSTGAKVGGEFLVNATTAGAQTAPYAEQLHNGTIVIAWTDASATAGDSSGTAVRARLFSPSGVPIGGDFLVNTTTLHSQSAPVVTVLADGRFVIVWGDSSEGNGSTGAFDPADIRAQIYDASGNRLGGEILVNSETHGFQGQGNLGVAAVSADSAGGFVVSWSSFGHGNGNGDGNSGAIKAQLFGTDGGKIGNEFLVNQTGDLQQSSPAVTYLADGDLMFAWWDLSGSRQGDVWAIAARRFDSAVQSDLPNVIEGTSGDDSLVGTAGADLMLGHDGTDRLYGGAGGDSLHGDDGDDLVLGQDGNDSLYGDAGNDLLRGGGGVDYFDGGSDTGLSPATGYGDRVSFLEERATQGVVADLRTGIVSNDGFGNVEQMVNIESLGSDTAYADTLYGNDSGNFLWAGLGDSLYGFGGDDRLQVSSAAAMADGGEGIDTLQVDSHYSAYRPDSNGDGIAEVAPPMTAGYSVSLAAGTVRDGFGNQGTVAAVENITGSALADDLRGDSGRNIIDGGDGNDVLRLQDGGDDTAIGGAGNDAFLFIGSLTSADVVDGGAGSDELVLQGDYSAGLTLGAVTGVELIVLVPGSDTRFGAPGTQLYSYSIATTDQNVAAGVQMNVDGNRLRAGENLVFDGSAETDGSFYVFAGKGVDTLTGGAKNDAFLFRGPGNFTGADTVNGGAGFDELALRGDYTGAYAVTFGATTISGIEAIVVISGHDLRYGKEAGDLSFDLTMNEANVVNGQVMIVDAGTLRAGEKLTFDGSAETDGGRFTMFGGKGNDVLTGGSGADSIRGGLGADVMKGNAGADTFVYRDTAESATGSVDQILDFLSGTDRIDLSRIDANTLVGGDQAFSWIGSNAFSGSGAAGQLRAYQDGANWFVEGDTNGDGTADLVIQLTGAAAIVQGDFLP